LSTYVLVESRSPLESSDVLPFLDLATQLSEAGHEVDLFLVANGALLPMGRFADSLASLSSRPGVTLWMDELAYAARSPGPSAPALPGWVRVSDMADLVRLVMRPGTTPIWH
jgi:hypothetical protein